MRAQIDLSKVCPASQISGEDEEDTRELQQMLSEAKVYVTSFEWCSGVEESFMGIGIPGVLGVFLFRICPAAKSVDDWVWVIVGDLPPAYITTEHAPNPASALDAYIGAMAEWVEAAKKLESVANLIPVNVPPTPENAQELERRLLLLDREVLAHYQDDLRS